MKAYLFLLCLMFAMCGCQKAAASEESTPFRVSSDPTVAVLTIEYVAAMTGRVTTYRLLSDGRFEAEERDRAGVRLSLSETEIGFDEIRELASIAVDGGLAASTRQDISRKAGGDLPKIADGTHTTLTLKLAEFRGFANYEHQISLVSPAKLARLVPDLEELEAFAKLNQRMTSLHRAAKAKRNE